MAKKTPQTYDIYTRDAEGERTHQRTIEADSPESAAYAYSQIVAGERGLGRVGVRRDTGDPGESGWFSIWQKLGQNSSTRLGHTFHVL